MPFITVRMLLRFQVCQKCFSWTDAELGQMRSAAVEIIIFFFSILLDTISSSIILSPPPLSRMLVTQLTLLFCSVFPSISSLGFISDIFYFYVFISTVPFLHNILPTIFVFSFQIVCFLSWEFHLDIFYISHFSLPVMSVSIISILGLILVTGFSPVMGRFLLLTNY